MQVYLEDRYVGELAIACYPGQRSVVLLETTGAIGFVDASMILSEPGVVRREFPVVERHASYAHDAHTLDMTPDKGLRVRELVQRRLNIPADADYMRTRDFHDRTVLDRWRWQVVRVSLEQYEWLFDQPSFEPA